ncbi:hypothetical protein TNCV_3383911 [Trichonephila clavipes]|uniref:Uncharacterized protein n=1 Tax=Trichonephila clavipes TaxID=2585209 RepID=A0A8X6T3N0_TRICX|nr:hypothetical protein TNCV_3383911 [Trichonephila clavipes]
MRSDITLHLKKGVSNGCSVTYALGSQIPNSSSVRPLKLFPSINSLVCNVIFLERIWGYFECLLLVIPRHTESGLVCKQHSTPITLDPTLVFIVRFLRAVRCLAVNGIRTMAIVNVEQQHKVRFKLFDSRHFVLLPIKTVLISVSHWLLCLDELLAGYIGYYLL